MMVSVVSAAASAVRDAFAGRGVGVETVGQELPCPLALEYATLETLGADRWLGALAAHRRYGHAITVDCGTATTVNLVTADGVFRGGAIAPGLEAMANGLARLAPALPRADLDGRVSMPAPSSQLSVDAGVLLGYLGLVERLVAELRKVAPPCTVVLTGGNAPRVLGRVGFDAVWAPDLLHEGMAALAGCIA